MSRAAVAGWGLLLLATAGCGNPEVRPMVAPEVVQGAALRAFRQGKFREALEGFRRAEVALPPRADAVAEVRFYIAECHLALGAALEAAQVFRRVADEFPTHLLAPYALLRAADANAELWRRPELDPTYGTAALAVYRELLARYPDSDVAARARARIRDLNDRFAEKDYKNGLFYLQRGAYDSAILYFRALVASYGQAKRVPDALLRLVEAYRAIGYQEELQETCAFLRQQYPSAPGLAEACPALR